MATIWACVPGWLVVLQCLLGHVAAMVGFMGAHRCHMGHKPLKAIHFFCTYQKYVLFSGAGAGGNRQ